MPTKIEWTDETWNPVTGCTKVSAGCANCYAERMAKRFHKGSGDHFAVRLHSDRLEQPLRWRKPRKVFVCSMGDLFHDDVPGEFIAAIFGIMAACPQHTFQVLTKRHERMREWFRWIASTSIHGGGTPFGRVLHASWQQHGQAADNFGPKPWPLPNVWLGVSAEDQRTADERIPALLQTPAAVRFVSVEPMLGEIRLDRLEYWWNQHTRHNLNALRGYSNFAGPTACLDWVICGGESGPGARPMHPDWARSLRDQCAEAVVPFFLKQMKVGGKMIKEPHLDGAQHLEYPNADA